MSKKSITYKEALKLAKEHHFDCVSFVGRVQGHNVYCCDYKVPTYGGLPFFIMSINKQVRLISPIDKFHRECFDLLANDDEVIENINEYFDI